MPNWTDEQKQAIYEKGENILVAAAAGSGKTAVLVERIINKVINEGIDIDKILVVTFTNAAAAEMRERILDALYKKIEEEPENERLQRQITLLNLASICTIDSFCLDIVKNHFYELENVSPNFRIADTAEIELLKQEVLEDLFEEKYINDDSNFAKLITTYTNYRDDTPLKELILKIHTFISSSPEPRKWLEEKIKTFDLRGKETEDFGKTIWGEILVKEVRDEIKDDKIILKDIQESLINDSELEDFAKIIAIADIYDAMTSDRVYRSAVCPFTVIHLMEQECFSTLDPKFALPFFKNVASSYIHNNVKLSNGETGEVVLINDRSLSRPVIRCKDKFIDLSAAPDLTITAIL